MSDDKVRICSHPFSRYESGYKPTYIPCCSAWLTDDYYAQEGGSDFWNGPAAQRLREKILVGDYSFCKRDQCQMPLKTMDEIIANPDGETGTPISAENLQAMIRGEVVMPDGPSAMILSLDQKCNLACPTCRTAKITTQDPVSQALATDELSLLWKNRATVKNIKMSGNSEIFFSPDQRKMLTQMSKENFPKLSYLHVITNGLLFTQKTLDDLRPGTDYIEVISLSIDAGSEEVYNVTRGGDWKRLQENIKLMKSMRLSKKLRYFELLYVVRKANFRDMENVVRIAHEASADRVRFIQFNVWDNMGIVDYDSEAVHLTHHPLHQEFREICSRLKNDPKVLIGFNI